METMTRIAVMIGHYSKPKMPPINQLIQNNTSIVLQLFSFYKNSFFQNTISLFVLFYHLGCYEMSTTTEKTRTLSFKCKLLFIVSVLFKSSTSLLSGMSYCGCGSDSSGTYYDAGREINIWSVVSSPEILTTGFDLTVRIILRFIVSTCPATMQPIFVNKFL